MLTSTIYPQRNQLLCHEALPPTLKPSHTNPTADGNELQKKLFEDAGFNRRAVTEEETNMETILEEETSKEEQNESNKSCPLDGELKPTPTTYEIPNINEEEAEHLSDFEAEQRNIKTCLDTHIQEKANNLLFRHNNWDPNHGLGSPILGEAEVIGNVRIKSYSSDLGQVVPETWCVAFKPMGDYDNRITIRFLQNTSTGELSNFGREVQFIFIVIDPYDFKGIGLKQMMTSSNVFEIRLKALHVDSSWTGKFVSAEEVTLIWLNVARYYKLKPFRGLTCDDSDDEDERSLTSTEEQEVVSFNGVSWLPIPEVSKLPTIESTKSLPDANNVDEDTAPTADMTETTQQGEDEIVSLLSESEVPDITRANCVDDHDVSGRDAELNTIMLSTITEVTADGLLETRLVREDVRKVNKKVDELKELLLLKQNTVDSSNSQRTSRRQYIHSSGTSLASEKKTPSGRPVPLRNATNTIRRTTITTTKKPLRSATNKPPSSIRRRSTTTPQGPSFGSSGSRKLPW